MGRKVIVIGLDGGTWSVIEPGVKSGLLPTFKKLMDEGVWGDLKSTIQPITAPAWASFLTGKNPGKHGIFDFYVMGQEAYLRKPVNKACIAGKTFYEILSENEKRIGMVNVPMTYPPGKVNGFIVSGMETPPGREYTYPIALQEELDAIGYEIEMDASCVDGREDEFIQLIERYIDKREKALFMLMNKHRWDFLMCVFRATDLVSHAFWRFSDKSHPLFDEELAKKYGDIISRVYQRIDEVLRRLVETLDKDTTLIIVSDHGFGPEHKMIHLNTWLKEQGLLSFKRNIKTYLKTFLFFHGFTPDRMWEIAVKSKLLRRVLLKDLKTRNKAAGRFFLSYYDVDWRRTLAYAVGSVGSWGLIFVGRKSEEHRLATQKIKELRAWIIRNILESRDPATGETIAVRVYEKEEVYEGPFLSEAPDVIVEWRDGYITYPFFSGGGKLISNSPPTRSGNHRGDGILIAFGDEISPGIRIQDAQIIDIAPTILHVLNVPIAEDIDGKVLKKIFKKSSEPAKREIDYQEAGEEEKDKIRNRVRKLKSRGKI